MRHVLDEEVTVRDRAVERCFGRRAELTIDQVSDFGDNERRSDQGCRRRFDRSTPDVPGRRCRRRRRAALQYR